MVIYSRFVVLIRGRVNNVPTVWSSVIEVTLSNGGEIGALTAVSPTLHFLCMVTVY